MIAYFDTSVLLPALVHTHPMHGKCFKQYEKVQYQKMTGVISQHVLLEIYAAGTVMPVKPRATGMHILQLAESSILPVFKIVSLTEVEILDALKDAAGRETVGGALYDLYHIHHAIKAGAEILLTNNVREFRRLATGYDLRIESP